MPGIKWSELSHTRFDQLDKVHLPVILPIGSMEQHGPHLPVATDRLELEAVLDGIFENLTDIDYLVLPTLWCSKSNEHIDFPGTVWLSRETLAMVVEDISASLARQKFNKLIMLNWHGGNIDLLTCLGRDIRQKFGLTTFMIDAFRMLISYPVDWQQPHSFNIHACRFETSVMLAKYPALVKDQKFWGSASDYAHGKMSQSFSRFRKLAPEGGGVSMGWLTSDLSDDGVIGDPQGSNAVDGQDMLNFVVERVCECLQEIALFEYQAKGAE